MTSLLDLPDDVLTEALGLLPALSVLSCRQVCRKLNQLTWVRHVWITIFNRTRHMLRPTMDPSKQPLSELGMAMARAEKLERIWTGTNGICAPPPRVYRLKNPDHWRKPLVVMGEYVVFLRQWGGPDTYQWVPKRNVSSVGDGNAVFEYVIPTYWNPVWDAATNGRHLHYMDHDSGTFYLISYLNSNDTDTDAQLVEIKIDGDDSRPYISTCSQVAVNPQARPIEYVTIKGHYVAIYPYSPDLEYEIDVNILDLQTKAVSQYRLVPPLPPTLERFWGKEIHASNTHLLLIINSGSDYCIFARPSAEEEELKSAQATPIPLRAIASGKLPLEPPLWRSYQVLYRANPPSFTIVGVRAGVPDDKMTKIYFLSLENSGSDWVLETQSKETQGFHAGGTILPMPSSEAECMLGVLSCRNVYETLGTDYRPKLRNINYQLLRVEGLNSEMGKTIDHLNLTRMDLAPWVDESVERLCFMDFDPFGGTALLVSEPAPEMGQGFQSIVVLDYLCKGDA